MKKQGKKWMLVVLALLAVVTVALPLVGCKNDSVAEPVRYTVKFANGSDSIEDETGKKEIEAVELPKNITVDSGTQLTAEQLKPLADTTSYVFTGWYDGETKVEADTYTVTKNVTLTAKWNDKNTVEAVEFGFEFLAEDAGTKATLRTGTEGATIKYKVNEETEWTNYDDATGITLTAETKKITAYATKEGWKDSEPVTKQYYTVTFNSNNGTGTMNPQTFTAGVEQELAANTTFTRENYIFIGWSEDSKATSATYSDKAKFTARKDTTLYAVWSDKILTFTSDSETALNTTFDNIDVPTGMEYSTDGKTWTAFTKGQTEISFVNGKDGKYVLYLRGKSPTGTATSTTKYVNFTFKDGTKVSASGDIRTLVDWNDPINADTSNARFSSLFEYCDELVTAPKLPATTLANYCYNKMFKDCTSLETAPELPATKLAESCYSYMFYGCTSLTTAPTELPAETLAKRCYNMMFRDCTSLETAPELPAKKLAQSCYKYMFRGCTSLTTAPELKAETLDNNCYEYMFGDCTNLASVTMLATDVSASYALYSWLESTAETGTLYVVDSTMVSNTIINDNKPAGWTVVAKTN